MSFTLNRACASTASNLCVNAFPDELDPFEPFAHLSLYRRGSPEDWVYTELKQYVERIILTRGLLDGARYFASLSAEGQFTVFGGSGVSIEQIAGAGMDGRGRMMGLNQIGSRIYASGMNGQIYVRKAQNDWNLLIDQFLFNPGPSSDRILSGPSFGEPGWAEWMERVAKEAPLSRNDFNDINGPAEDDLYIAGTNGMLIHWDGTRATELLTGVTDTLTWIEASDPDRIVVCGHGGVVLVGNSREGFQDVNEYSSVDLFNSAARLGSTCYLTASALPGGLFALDRNNSITRVEMGSVREPTQLHTATVADEVLWLVGLDGIVRFDGRSWETVSYPGLGQ